MKKRYEWRIQNLRLETSWTCLFLFVCEICATCHGQVSLRIDTERRHELEMSEAERVCTIRTTGEDPWLVTLALTEPRPKEARVLSFEYFCPQGLDHLQIFFGDPAREERSYTGESIGSAEGWVPFSLDLRETIGDWGRAGDVLRLDLGRRAGIDLQIRNLQLRSPTAYELQREAEREAKKQQQAGFRERLEDYLAQDYDAQIQRVEVGEQTISILGDSHLLDQVTLTEVPPYEDVTEMQTVAFSQPITQRHFSVSVDRYVTEDGRRRDRLLSKWVLVQRRKNEVTILSHARYPDAIVSKHDLPKEVPTSRKGLGGFSTQRGHIEDLKALDITSATVNVWFTRFMFTEPGPNRIEHVYQGQPYYFRAKDVAAMDETFRTCAKHKIVAAAILLVSKAEQCLDPQIGRLTQHPDMHPSGIYSMPNMTTLASTQCYAAALDFLASRYSRPDKKYGRCHHWIMHNEVDAGWVWTNMGEKPAAVFMDAYHKSMRLCYAIARSYNPHSEVFVSLTHHWAWTSRAEFYPSRDLMDILLDYTRAEGDFQWALAHHPYPESLHEPKTWNDQKATYDFNTPLITFKNLEVLDAWIKQPEVLYRGKHKRTLWLSENGTNSPTYSEQDLTEQAAGFAYAWKKMKPLDGIDGFQWHNWFDSRREGGLRIGLRRFPDDAKDPGGIKPVWQVYQAADTGRENAVFAPYKQVIGINHWDQVRYRDSVAPGRR